MVTKYKGSILWVDDEIHHLKPHILYLNQKGYEVTKATNGHDAEVLTKNNEIMNLTQQSWDSFTSKSKNI